MDFLDVVIDAAGDYIGSIGDSFSNKEKLIEAQIARANANTNIALLAAQKGEERKDQLFKTMQYVIFASLLIFAGLLILKNFKK